MVVTNAWVLSFFLGIMLVHDTVAQSVVLSLAVILSLRVMLYLSQWPGHRLKGTVFDYQIQPGFSLFKLGLFGSAIVGFVVCGLVWRGLGALLPSMNRLHGTSVYLGRLSLLFPTISVVMLLYCGLIGMIKRKSKTPKIGDAIK